MKKQGGERDDRVARLPDWPAFDNPFRTKSNRDLHDRYIGIA
jgi:hypothetical protein